MTQRTAAFALTLLACSSNSPDQTTLVGTTAFSPTSTVMVTKGLHCSNTGVSSGGLDALTIVIADTDLAVMGCPSGQFDILPHSLRLEVATAGYFAADPSAVHDPIEAGTTFPIVDEHVSDEDLCGNVQDTTHPVALAMLGVCPNGLPCSADYWATTGSITVSSISATSAAGSFDVMLVDDDGNSHGALSGTFDATTCP